MLLKSKQDITTYIYTKYVMVVGNSDEMVNIITHNLVLDSFYMTSSVRPHQLTVFVQTSGRLVSLQNNQIYSLR